ncbi:MAG: hypothetical protein M9927_13915 [Anaerolineae bacterium]|nr:hypothetical protein [Anaerolineae bacterium]
MTKNHRPLLIKGKKRDQSTSVGQPIALLILMFLLASCQATPLVRQDENPAVNPSVSESLDRLPDLFTESGLATPTTLVAATDLPVKASPQPDTI